MQWFGKAYGAPYERDCPRVETPVGVPCAWCDEVIVEGDDGVTVPHVERLDRASVERPYHYACHLRGIVGGVNHQLGVCVCCGGTLPPDPPEITRREAAEAAVWAFNHWRQLDPFESPGNRGG